MLFCWVKLFAIFSEMNSRQTASQKTILKRVGGGVQQSAFGGFWLIWIQYSWAVSCSITQCRFLHTVIVYSVTCFCKRVSISDKAIVIVIIVSDRERNKSFSWVQPDMISVTHPKSWQTDSLTVPIRFFSGYWLSLSTRIRLKQCVWFVEWVRFAVLFVNCLVPFLVTQDEPIIVFSRAATLLWLLRYQYCKCLELMLKNLFNSRLLKHNCISQSGEPCPILACEWLSLFENCTFHTVMILLPVAKVFLRVSFEEFHNSPSLLLLLF